MYVYLSKILPIFVMPVSLVLLLVLVALLLLRKDRKKTAGSVLLLSFVLLWVAAMPLTADVLYGSLESRFPPQPLTNVPDADCAVVLGGVVSAAVPPRLDVDMNDSIDRVYKAAQLQKAGKTKYVIVTAGNQPWSQSPWAEADLIRDLLVQWGVPEKKIYLEGSSRNTRENALYSKNVIDSINCGTTLLVTSAAHMPRSVAAFRSVGLTVVPVSTDVRIAAQSLPRVTDFLPSATALAMTSDAIREWIGQFVYSLNGWD